MRIKEMQGLPEAELYALCLRRTLLELAAGRRSIWPGHVEGGYFVENDELRHRICLFTIARLEAMGRQVRRTNTEMIEVSEDPDLAHYDAEPWRSGPPPCTGRYWTTDSPEGPPPNSQGGCLFYHTKRDLANWDHRRFWKEPHPDLKDPYETIQDPGFRRRAWDRALAAGFHSPWIGEEDDSDDRGTRWRIRSDAGVVLFEEDEAGIETCIMDGEGFPLRHTARLVARVWIMGRLRNLRWCLRGLWRAAGSPWRWLRRQFAKWSAHD